MRYVIEGLIENANGCPLCLEPSDGRSKDARPRPVFNVSCEGGGGYSGACCSSHLAAIIRMGEQAKAPKAAEVNQVPAKPTNPIPAATLAANGPPAPAAVK